MNEPSTKNLPLVQVGNRFPPVPVSSSDNVPPGDKCLSRVLLVDDEENMIVTMKAGLQMLLQCEIVAATSGEQALRLFEKAPFDLLITDFRMPGMDGLALAMRVRQSYPQIGIVMITAYGDDDFRERAARIPIQSILDKPVNLIDICRAALAALDGAHPASTVTPSCAL